MLSVAFNIPESISVGLDNGTMERIGGVIRDVASKQVVAWLREGDISSSLNLTDITRLFGSLGQLGGLASVVNVGVTVVTTMIVSHKLDLLNRKLDRHSDLIKSEFRHDRDANFQVALDSAKDILEGLTSRRDSALDGLNKTRRDFIKYYQDNFSLHEQNPKYLYIAQDNLIRALWAETMRIRCYVTLENANVARKRLQENQEALTNHAKELVKAWIGNTPSVYFHQEFSNEVLERFVLVQHWLREENPRKRQNLWALLHEMRQQFWDLKVIEAYDVYDKGIPNRMKNPLNRPIKRLSDRKNELAENLLQAEIMIENMQRLRGFELELEAVERLEVSELEDQLTPQTLDENGGLAVIVDEEMLARLAKR